MQNYFSKTQPLIEKAVFEVFPQKKAPDSFQLSAEIWEEAFSKPFYELFKRGGKRLRPLLACLTYHSFGGKSEQIYPLATIPEILHTGTLIIDDIEDHSDLRRGEPAIHKIFAENLAINTGNFLYFFPQLILQQIDFLPAQKEKIIAEINTEMLKLHLGQGMDIAWSNQKKYEVKVADYLQMSAYKTGTLLNLALQIGGIFANQSQTELQKLAKIAKNLGLAFQIQDDFLNLQKSADLGKTYGEDLQEGKLTYLVALTLEIASQTEKNALISILQKAKNTAEEIEKAVEIMQKNQVFEKTEKFCRSLITESEQSLETLNFEAKYQRIWKEVLAFIIQRKK